MKGFTLFELLITMMISSLLLGLAVPGFGLYIEKNRSDVAAAELFTALLFTRNYAVSHAQTVHICGSNNGLTCESQWSRQLIAFIDHNDNKQPEAEEVIRLFPLDLGDASVRSRIAFAKAYTTFKPTGQASLAGSLIYCPAKREPQNYKRVTWNRVGRAYQGVDSNGDGMVDDTSGRSLATACPT